MRYCTRDIVLFVFQSFRILYSQFQLNALYFNCNAVLIYKFLHEYCSTLMCAFLKTFNLINCLRFHTVNGLNSIKLIIDNTTLRICTLRKNLNLGVGWFKTL